MLPALVGFDGGNQECPETLWLEFTRLSFTDPQVQWAVFDKFCATTEDSGRRLSPIWSLCLLGVNDNDTGIFRMGSHPVLVPLCYFHSSSEEDFAE